VPVGGGGTASPSIMAQLLELNELQEGRAVDDDRSLPGAVIESVEGGFSEYAVVGTLEGHSEESRELLSLCRQIVERGADELRGARDIVHWGFTFSNLLVEGERVTGVIDWAGTRSGDRLFDLATLVYYARGEASELERYVIERIGEEGLAVYLTHMSVRQSDWSLRHHGQDGDEVVRYSLELIRRFS